MGWRNKADRLKAAAAARAEELRRSETFVDFKDAAASGIDRARNSDALSTLDVAALKDVVVSSSGVAGRRGEIKRWRVAKAAINPTATATSVAKGVAAERMRQKRSNTASGEGTASPNAWVAADDDAPLEH